MSPREIQPGDQVRVVSGPHEGRGGRVVYIKPQAMGHFAEPEPFALIEYADADAPGGRDQIAVPVRRLQH